MYDLVAIGEYLVDFTPVKTEDNALPIYQMNPGGAPINCLTACARLGGQVSMIGTVGNDLLGRFLVRKAREVGVDTSGIRFTGKAPTTMTFVQIEVGGERDFSFVRNPGADTLLREEDVDCRLTREAKFFHFGSVSLTTDPTRSSTMYAVEKAKRAGAKISFDPNFRDTIWESWEQASRYIRPALELADIVKLSLEEFQLVTGLSEENVESGIKMLLSMGIEEVYVTAGKKGAYYGTAYDFGFEPAFSVNSVDTTGCGDAFLGAILYQNVYRPSISVGEKVRFANAVAAICSTRPGGMYAMPTQAEVYALINL